MAFSYLTNKIGVLDLDRLYGVLDIVVDVISIAGLALALRAPGGRKRMLVIASTFLPVVLCTCPGCFVWQRTQLHLRHQRQVPDHRHPRGERCRRGGGGHRGGRVDSH